MFINHTNQYKNEREARWKLAEENEAKAIVAITNILKNYYPNVKFVRYDIPWFRFYNLDAVGEEHWVKGVSDYIIGLNSRCGIYAEMKVKQHYFKKTITGGITKLGTPISKYGCYSVYLDIHPVYQNIHDFIQIFGLKKSSFIIFFAILENNQFENIHFINMEELEFLISNGFNGQKISIYGEGYGTKTKEGRANCYLIPIDAMHKFGNSENSIQYFNECSSNTILYPIDILKNLYK